MRKLELRKLAKPLAEARKDPSINDAALFVEKIFGRPMHSEPSIIIITPKNCRQFIERVRRDYGHAAVFVPFPQLLSKETMDEFEERKMTVFGFADFLSPVETRKAWNEIGGFGCTRHSLLNIGELDQRPRKLKTIRAPTKGIALADEKIIVIRHSQEYPDLVHELVHFEDYEIFGQLPGKFQRVVREGRAVFAEEAFKWCRGSDMPLELEYKFLGYFFPKLAASRFEVARTVIQSHGLKQLVDEILTLIKTTTIDEQLTYYPYASALMRLSNVIGNPFLAFRISTEKQPGTWMELLKPLEFYKEEIRRLEQSL